MGGDFFLAVEGPRGSTVLVVGDVVGKGVTAAQRAVFVRTSLVTFAPVRGRPGAAAAARQRGADRSRRDVGRLRHGGLRRPPPGGRDARVGDRRSSTRRSRLGSGARSTAAGRGSRSGSSPSSRSRHDRSAERRTAACCSTRTGSSTRATSTARRFGEERLSALVGGVLPARPPRAVVEHLRVALADFSPAGRRRRVPARGAQSPPRIRPSGAGRLRDRRMKKVEPFIALELPAEPHSAKVARDAVAGLDGHLGEVFGDVVLVISELVTNSVRHAGLDASAAGAAQRQRGGRHGAGRGARPGSGLRRRPSAPTRSGARRRLGPRARRAARGRAGASSTTARPTSSGAS